MTTPERLKRRQHLLGFFIMVMGLALIGQSVYFNNRDDKQNRRLDEQQACLMEEFEDLSAALDARATLIDKESEAVRKVWSVYGEAAGLLQEDPTAPLPPKDEERLQIALVHALLDYEEAQDEVAREREKHPIPPYPSGKCE